MFGFVKKAVRSVVKTGLRIASASIKYVSKFHRLSRLALLFGIPAGILFAGAVLADMYLGSMRGGYDSAGQSLDDLDTNQALKYYDILLNSQTRQQPTYPNLPGLIV